MLNVLQNCKTVLHCQYLFNKTQAQKLKQWLKNLSTPWISSLETPLPTVIVSCRASLVFHVFFLAHFSLQHCFSCITLHNWFNAFKMPMSFGCKISSSDWSLCQTCLWSNMSTQDISWKRCQNYYSIPLLEFTLQPR